jgi:multiple sugar transport system permease protein
MTALVRRAPFVAVAAIALWATLLAWGSLSVGARAEYAVAAFEARTVARAITADSSRRPSPRRRIIAEGPLTRVRIEMQRAFGPRAASRVSEDRVLLHARGFSRAVSIPLKDRDDWEVVGAVVLEAQPLQNALPIVIILLATFCITAPLGYRGVRRIADDGKLSVYAAMIVPVASLSIGSALVVALMRRNVAIASAALPPPSPLARFDSLALPLPNGQLAGFLLALVLFLTAGALFATGWAASARRHAAQRREILTAWSFLAPSALHLALFTAIPLVFTLFVSLHDWDLLRDDKPFVGLANYISLSRDPLFWRALANTFAYSLYVPVSMALALGAALLLDQPLKGIRVLRAIVFLPTIVSYAAIAIVWQWIFNVDFGLLNTVLRAVHLPGVDWLGNPKTALIAVMIVSAWVQIGYQMVIYLAGLQGIPSYLYEAARLDGAGAWERFRFITLPMLRPVSVYLLVTGVIWSFQVFTLVYVMTEGGPVHATDVLVYQIYQNAWEFRRMGYASAMSWILFAILVVFTILQWRFVNRETEHAA